MTNRFTLLFSALVLAGSLRAQTGGDSTLVIVGGQEAALAYNRGITEFNGGAYNAALKSFSEATGIDSKFFQAYYNRGLTELKKNLDREALKDFTDAIALSGKKPEYYLARAIAYSRLGNYAEALRAVQKAESLKYSPDKIKYFYGYVYFLQGDYKKAEQSFTEAVDKNAKYAYAYCDRAAVRIKMSDFKAALDDYETALKIMPYESYIYVLRAWAKAYMNNYSGALSDINTALASDKTKELEYLNERANIYTYFKKYKLAEGDFNKCLAANPDFLNTYVNMGNMLMEQKKYAGAQKCFTSAIERDAGNIAAYNNRANAKELQFDLKGAEADRRIVETLLNRLKP